MTCYYCTRTDQKGWHMAERYLPPVNGGRWAVSRFVSGKWLKLVEDSYLEESTDAEVALAELGVLPTQGNLDVYFPIRNDGERRPTLDTLERFSKLGSKIKKEHGV